ncbi:unnamed protein product, partial [Darwinula stevensoni]
SWLKLPKDTPITFIHAGAPDGGLGIKQLANGSHFGKRDRWTEWRTPATPLLNISYPNSKTRSTGIRKPDLLVTFDNITHVIDAQVVNDYDDPEILHERKSHYYNETIRDWIKTRTKAADVKFSTITFTWRGIMAETSANDLRRLSLKPKDLKIASIRVLEQTHKCWTTYNGSTKRKWGKRIMKP